MPDKIEVETYQNYIGLDTLKKVIQRFHDGWKIIHQEDLKKTDQRDGEYVSGLLVVWQKHIPEHTGIRD